MNYLLEGLLTKHITYTVNSTKYFEPFLKKLSVTQKYPITYTLEINPYVTYELIQKNIILKTDFLNQFREYSKNPTNADLYFFAHQAFLNLVVAIITQSEIYVKNLIEARNMKQRSYQLKDLNFTYDLIQFIKQSYSTEISLEMDGRWENPMSYNFLSQFFLTYSNRKLKKAKFNFHQIEENKLNKLD